MAKSDNGTEYEFNLPDGTKAYEIVFEPRDVHAFMRLHKATRGAPVRPAEEPTP